MSGGVVDGNNFILRWKISIGISEKLREKDRERER